MDKNLQHQAEEAVLKAFIFVKKYEWMINSYVAEFFCQDLWKKLPVSWQECLEGITLEDIANNMLKHDSVKSYSSVWPLSLLSFIATCHSLWLPRKPKCNGKRVNESVTLTGVFSKHIKPKKRHELALLPQVVDAVCKATESSHVMDVGSGLGHLPRMLAFRYGYNVTAVEMAGHRLPRAENFDKQMEKELSHQNKENQSKHGIVNHIAQEINPDISADAFSLLLSNGTEEKEQKSYKNCVLIGLHTCGNLGPTMLKIFDSLPHIRGIVSVSCCYMGMTLKEECHCPVNNESTISESSITQYNEGRTKDIFENDSYDLESSFDSDSMRKLWQQKKSNRNENISYSCISTSLSRDCTIKEKSNTYKSEILCTQSYSFPLSQFLRTLKIQPFKYKSFECACHFIDDQRQKLLEASPKLKLHCYRAAMEVFIRLVEPSLVLTAVRCKKIKNAANLTFIEYAEKVFERLKKPFCKEKLNDISYEQLLSQWKNVLIYHSLLVLMGPVVESVALRDKQLFLLEKGYSATLTPEFDPAISPRNIVLVATKEKKIVL